MNQIESKLISLNAKTEFENNIVDDPSYSETEIAYINKQNNIYALKHYWYEGGFYIFFLGTENTVYKTRYSSIIYNEDETKWFCIILEMIYGEHRKL